MTVSFQVVAGGAQEELSTGHGFAMAEAGMIIPPESVNIDQNLGAVNYQYPLPNGPIGVYVDIGNYTMTRENRKNLIQVGLRGGKTPFEELPPLNLSYVIDISGSMGGSDKLTWVKKSFATMMEKLRPDDFLSVIVFDDKGEVLVPGTRITKDNKKDFVSAVDGLEPRGGTDLMAGLPLAYQEVMKNFRSEYTNRVLFLTDGQGNHQGMFEMAESYADLDIFVSAIGVGLGFDADVLNQLTRSGEGSSRFLYNEKSMIEAFSTEFDRLVVAAAKDVEIQIVLGPGFRYVDSWGRDVDQDGQILAFLFPTLHNGDYETVLVETEALENTGGVTESLDLAEISVSYRANLGKSRLSAYERAFRVDLQEQDLVLDGYSNYRILLAGAILDYSHNLIEIGELFREYPSMDDETDKSVLDRSMAITRLTKDNLEKTAQRSDNPDIFVEEIELLENYIKNIPLMAESQNVAISDVDAGAKTKVETQLSLTEQIAQLSVETVRQAEALELSSEDIPRVAVTNIFVKTMDAYPNEIVQSVNSLVFESARTAFAQSPNFGLVAPDDLLAYMSSRDLTAELLMDTVTATKAAADLNARFIHTGTLLEFGNEFVLFTRLVDAETENIVCSGQLIFEKERFLQQFTN